MTYDELDSLYWIKTQIDSLEKEYTEIESLKGSGISDMPRGEKVIKPTEEIVALRVRYAEKINKEREKYWKKRTEILNFIDGLEDEEAKTLARYRFIYCKSWYKITWELYHNKCDVYTPRRWLKRYIDKVTEKEKARKKTEKQEQ